METVLDTSKFHFNQYHFTYQFSNKKELPENRHEFVSNYTLINDLGDSEIHVPYAG